MEEEEPEAVAMSVKSVHGQRRVAQCSLVMQSSGVVAGNGASRHWQRFPLLDLS
jgi:hypothetical protein